MKPVVENEVTLDGVFPTSDANEGWTDSLGNLAELVGSSPWRRG